MVVRACGWLIALGLSPVVLAGDWPAWRGPHGNGVSPEKNLPVHWDAANGQNIRWKVPVPGPGNSSPIVWRDRIFLTSMLDDAGTRAILCFRRQDGQPLWQAINPSKAQAKLTGDGAKAGQAAPTPVTDGTHVYAFFGPAGVLCVDFDGKVVWHHDAGPLDHIWGIAASAVLWRDLVIINGDNHGPSFLLALDKKTGQVVWKTPRLAGGGWSTPLVIANGDRDELIVSGPQRVTAYDPGTGKELWYCEGLGDIICSTPVAGHGLVYVPTGSNGPTLAIKPGGQGNVTSTHVAWKSRRGAPYVSSPVLYGENLYMVNNGGLLTCLDARTGKQVYVERLAGSFAAAPVAADDKLYLVNEDGDTHVIKAGAAFALLATNRLGEPCLASPAIAGGEIVIRTEKQLVCIMNKE
jgi:outer membrane protein assembly factor BamB